jgi:anti-sigma regulatory factor (Ser/Thr protein kinase)
MDTSVAFPGIPAIVPAARRFVRGMLEDSPRGDDMELIAAELISNAILHSLAGETGGKFVITLRTLTGWARVEVADPGVGQWHPRAGGTESDYGRGLAIVAALADKFGHGAGPDGQVVWAEVTWPKAPGT